MHVCASSLALLQQTLENLRRSRPQGRICKIFECYSLHHHDGTFISSAISNEYVICLLKSADWERLVQSNVSYPVVHLKFFRTYSKDIFICFIEVCLSLVVFPLFLMIHFLTSIPKPTKSVPQKFLQTLHILYILICHSATHIHLVVQSTDKFPPPRRINLYRIPTVP